MNISSHALYLTLTQDLSKYLDNSNEIWNPHSYSRIPQSSNCFQSPRHYAASALTRSILKKFEDEPAPDADTRALDLFMEMNDLCRGFSFDLWSLSEPEVHVFTLAREYISDWYYSSPLSELSILTDADFGPGASIAAKGNSFLHKAGCSPLTATDGSMYSFYLESLRNSRLSLTAEKARRDRFGRPEVVKGCKFHCVPKSTEISRTICVEPSLNMFLQKGTQAYLEELLTRNLGFDLERQQFRNKRLARRGSESGRFSTIDLSSASDTISLNFCEWILPRELYAWLTFIRSPEVQLPNGSWLELHMMSSMGNATTFPLQTIIFSALACAAYRVTGVQICRPTCKPGSVQDGNVGVFGDDIVVESSVYPLLMSVLKSAGFIPNASKSFNVGLFRESCGGDYFDGHYVRGVYCKTLRGTHAVYSLINRLNVWSANNDILLPATIQLLMAGVRFLPVPPWEADIAGIKVSSAYAPSRQSNHLLKDGKTWSNGSWIYRRLQARETGLSMVDVTGDSKELKRFRLTYNPDAIFVAAVKGTLRNGKLTVRLDSIRPKYRFGIAPCWDYVDLAHSHLESGRFEAWKLASSANLRLAE